MREGETPPPGEGRRSFRARLPPASSAPLLVLSVLSAANSLLRPSGRTSPSRPCLSRSLSCGPCQPRHSSASSRPRPPIRALKSKARKSVCVYACMRACVCAQDRSGGRRRTTTSTVLALFSLYSLSRRRHACSHVDVSGEEPPGRVLPPGP